MRGVKEIRECQHCGAAFPFYASSLKRGNLGLYCSARCSGRARAKGQEHTCATCGTPFWVFPNQLTAPGRKNLYCSHRCWSLSPTGQETVRRPWSAQERVNMLAALKHRKPRARRPLERRICEQCGVGFELTGHLTTAKRASRRFCGMSCYHLWERAHPEQTAPYVHGQGAGGYAPGFNRQLKARIRVRDGDVCQMCGRTTERTWTIHHIDGRKDDHSAGNLVLLCWSCHGVVHRAANRAQLHWRLIVQMAQRIAGYLPAPIG
jgi:hypothetical protein